MSSTMDLILYRNRTNSKKNMGFGADGGFDFTKELKEILRKKKGFGANGGFSCTKEKRELIVKNYEKKEGVWAQRWI